MYRVRITQINRKGVDGSPWPNGKPQWIAGWAQYTDKPWRAELYATKREAEDVARWEKCGAIRTWVERVECEDE